MPTCPEVRDMMTRPRVERDLLISLASSRVSSTAPVLDTCVYMRTYVRDRDRDRDRDRENLLVYDTATEEKETMAPTFSEPAKSTR